jgi:DNA-binding MarR family transcriptional regulator
MILCRHNINRYTKGGGYMIHQETLEFMLREVGKAHTNKINKVLGEVGLHNGQPMMLRILYRNDGVPQSYLAKELAIKAATASAMVKRLEKGGYVVRKRDSVDERVSNVYLTDLGRELSTKLKCYQKQMDNMVFEGFTDAEKKTMKDFLNRIHDNLTN